MTAGARKRRRGDGGTSRRTAGRLAWALWALSVPLVACSGLLGFLGASAQDQPYSALPILLALLLLTYPTVGALVASRRPGNPIGWIFCAMGLIFGSGFFAESYADYALSASTRPLPGAEYAAWFSNWASFPAWFLAATMLFLLFPDGRLPSPLTLWRPVAWTAVIGGAMSALGGALGPGTDEPSIANPVGVGGAVGNFLAMLGGFGRAFLALSCFASMASPFLRLRRARGQERQQLKWFVYASVLTAVSFLLAFAWPRSAEGSLAWKLGEVVWNLMIVGFMVLPITTAIAILKYRLYDIDRLINRTLVYGALTAALVAVYFGGVVGLQWVFRALAGGSSQLAVVASTLAIAALFDPLRRRTQSFVDRLFYRRKYDAAKTLAAFTSRLRDETVLDALSEDLVGVVRETVQPAHVSLWLRPGPAPEESGGPEQPNG